MFNGEKTDPQSSNTSRMSFDSHEEFDGINEQYFSRVHDRQDVIFIPEIVEAIASHATLKPVLAGYEEIVSKGLNIVMESIIEEIFEKYTTNDDNFTTDELLNAVQGVLGLDENLSKAIDYLREDCLPLDSEIYTYLLIVIQTTLINNANEIISKIVESIKSISAEEIARRQRHLATLEENNIDEPEDAQVETQMELSTTPVNYKRGFFPIPSELTINTNRLDPLSESDSDDGSICSPRRELPKFK